jgi:hypothetical protein
MCKYIKNLKLTNNNNSNLAKIDKEFIQTLANLCTEIENLEFDEEPDYQGIKMMVD